MVSARQLRRQARMPDVRILGLVWIAASPGEPRPGRSIQPQALEIDGLGKLPGPDVVFRYRSTACLPGTIVDSAENLGEVLRGDRIENSLYVVSLYHYSTINLCLSVLSVRSERV